MIRFESNIDKVLKDLNKQVKSLNGAVSFGKLFPASFMVKYTSFSAIDELFKSGGYEINSQDDLNTIDETTFDEFIKSSTRFNSWQEMFAKAVELYYTKNLKL